MFESAWLSLALYVNVSVPLDPAFDHPHNDYLGILYDYGFVGLGLLAWFTVRTARLLRHIRKAIVTEHDIVPHEIALLRPGALPKTTSGKIQRALARQLWLTGGLDRLGERRDRADEEEGRSVGIASPYDGVNVDGSTLRRREAERREVALL